MPLKVGRVPSRKLGSDVQPGPWAGKAHAALRASRSLLFGSVTRSRQKPRFSLDFGFANACERNLNQGEDHEHETRPRAFRANKVGRVRTTTNGCSQTLRRGPGLRLRRFIPLPMPGLG